MNYPFHVLIIAPAYYTYINGPRGSGGTIFQYDQAHALRRAGLKVGVLAPYGRSLRMLYKEYYRIWNNVDLTDDNGVASCIYNGFHWLSGRLRFVNLSQWFYCSIGRRLFEKYIHAYGLPDIIHAHNTVPAGILSRKLADEFRIPYVITEHSSAYASGEKNVIHNPEIRRSWVGANVRIVVSPTLGDLVNEVLKTNCSCQYVPNMLDPLFAKVSIEKAVTNNRRKFVFCNVASLTDIKNHKVLIHAFNQAFMDDDNVSLIIVGDGHLREELLRLTKACGLEERISFKGPMNREGVKDVLTECDAFVLSSAYETFGVVLIEAMACGKPVIATFGSGPDCIVTERDGILVPPGDIAKLSLALTQMRNEISNYNNRQIRESCIVRFGAEAVVSRLLEVYRDVLYSKAIPSDEITAGQVLPESGSYGNT